MFIRNNLNKFLTTLTAVAVMCVYSNVAFAQTGVMGGLTVTGNVTVNGQPAVSSSTVVTNSRITSGANSGAVISFGANGSVELFENTTINLKFTTNSIVAMLTDGKIRITNAPGIGATVTTRTATVVGDSGRANSFIVRLGCGDEDQDCRETFVETSSGLAVMTSLNDPALKEIPANTQGASGDTCSNACLRPGAAPPIPIVPNIGSGFLGAIIGGIGAAIIAAVLVNGGNTEIDPIPPAIVVSPSS